MYYVAIIVALILSGCTLGANDGISMLQALEKDNATACLYGATGYPPYTGASCACRSNPANGSAVTMSVGSSACTITAPSQPVNVNVNVPPAAK